MSKPQRSLRLEKRSSRSLEVLSGAPGEIFFDNDNGTLRVYTDNAGDSIIMANRQWVTENTFDGNYNNLTNVPAGLSNFANDANFATETFVSNAIAAVAAVDLTGLGLATETYVDDAIAAVAAVDLTGLATETFVGTAINNLVNSAPAALDTLNELSVALNNDANFATTVTTALGLKVDSSSLATVATSGSYSDLTGTPVLEAVATSGSYSDLTGTPVLEAVATSGSYNDLTDTPTLAAVATSGSYSDLTGNITAGTIDAGADITTVGNITASTTIVLNGATTGQPGGSGQPLTINQYDNITTTYGGIAPGNRSSITRYNAGDGINIVATDTVNIAGGSNARMLSNGTITLSATGDQFNPGTIELSANNSTKLSTDDLGIWVNGQISRTFQEVNITASPVNLNGEVYKDIVIVNNSVGNYTLNINSSSGTFVNNRKYQFTVLDTISGSNGLTAITVDGGSSLSLSWNDGSSTRPSTNGIVLYTIELWYRTAGSLCKVTVS